MKETIDIEKLLEWAYRRQCIDRVSRQNRATTPKAARAASGESFMRYGCRIDNPTPPSAFAALAPADAEIIHDAVLALDEMFIDHEGGVWTRERAGAIGARITRDKGRMFWLEVGEGRAPLECAHLAAIVITHAKTGGRPEWCEGWRPMGAAQAGDRSALDARGRRRKEAPAFTPQDVAFYRAEYRCWHAALVLLAAQLAGALKDFEPAEPQVAAHPWQANKKAA